jgi:hypothetical protein
LNEYKNYETTAIIWERYLDRSSNYMELRMTSWSALAAFLGLMAALFFKVFRPICLALITYSGVYAAVLFLAYIQCWRGYEQDILISLERFLSVPLDVAYLVALSIGAILLTRFVVKVASYSSSRQMFAFLLASIGTIYLLSHSLIRLPEQASRLANPFASGHQYPHSFVEKRLPIILGAPELRRLVSATNPNTERAKVIVVSQGSDGFQRFLLRYYALGTMRGGPLHLYDIMPMHSWAPVSGNPWASIIKDPTEINSSLIKADIIWPRNIDKFIGPVLGNFVDSQVCANNILFYFLWRSDPGMRYRCVMIEGMLTYTKLK